MKAFYYFKEDFKEYLKATGQKVVVQTDYQEGSVLEVKIVSITHLNTPRVHKLNRKLNLR